MKRKIDDDAFSCEAMVGDLTQLFEDGNALRIQRGKVAIDMNEWFNLFSQELRASKAMRDWMDMNQHNTKALAGAYQALVAAGLLT
jgi:hypothetical protein